ncbi:MAG: hypothetical protein HeimC3_35650 [Candidatus Heimdallarchaeota archaeon LC_3]|nr:MAG: hypothetical protein HeimC3_35650 [Candidatus Heimdallarchaeota archaeon LC_3]
MTIFNSTFPEVMKNYIDTLFSCIIHSKIKFSDHSFRILATSTYKISEILQDANFKKKSLKWMEKLDLHNLYQANIDLAEYYCKEIKEKETFLEFLKKATLILNNFSSRGKDFPLSGPSITALMKVVIKSPYPDLIEEYISFTKILLEKYQIKDRITAKFSLAEVMNFNNHLSQSLVNEASLLLKSKEFKREIYFNPVAISSELYLAYQNNATKDIREIIRFLSLISEHNNILPKLKVIMEFIDYESQDEAISKHLWKNALKKFLERLFELFFLNIWTNSAEKSLFTLSLLKILPKIPVSYLNEYRDTIKNIFLQNSEDEYSFNFLKMSIITKNIILHRLEIISTEQFMKGLQNSSEKFVQAIEQEKRPNFLPKEINALLSYALEKNPEFWIKTPYNEFFSKKLQQLDRNHQVDSKTFKKTINLFNFLDVEKIIQLNPELGYLEKEELLLTIEDNKSIAYLRDLLDPTHIEFWKSIAKTSKFQVNKDFKQAQKLVLHQLTDLALIIESFNVSEISEYLHSSEYKYLRLYQQLLIILIELNGKLSSSTHIDFLDRFEEKVPYLVINISKSLVLNGFVESAKKILFKYHNDSKYSSGLIEKEESNYESSPLSIIEFFNMMKARALRKVGLHEDSKIEIGKVALKSNKFMTNTINELLYLNMEKLLEEYLEDYFSYLKSNPDKMMINLTLFPPISSLDSDKIDQNIFQKYQNILTEGYENLLTNFQNDTKSIGSFSVIFTLCSILLQLKKCDFVRSVLNIVLKSIEQYIRENNISEFKVNNLKTVESLKIISVQEIERLLLGNIHSIPSSMHPIEYFKKLEKNNRIIQEIKFVYKMLFKNYQLLNEKDLAALCLENTMTQDTDVLTKKKEGVHSIIQSSIQKLEFDKAEKEIIKLTKELETKKFKYYEQLRPYIKIVTDYEKSIKKLIKK